MSESKKRYFPIQSKVSCRLKWSWSTLFLNSGQTSSCHRASLSELTKENFFEFHNTEKKLGDRTRMLQGQWPGNGCEYCRDIEQADGISDRQIQLSIAGPYPQELDQNQNLIKVDPVLLEIFFKNTCNLACIYCTPAFSSRIDGEDKKFDSKLIKLAKHDEILAAKKYDELSPIFWQWLDNGYTKLKRISILGGEPFIQDDFFKLIDYIESNPNKDLELQVITNLIVKREILEKFVSRIKELLANRVLKRIEIMASVDCWGVEQEYIRYGFSCSIFEENINYLLKHKFITLTLMSTITSLSIQTLPILAEKVLSWNKEGSVKWWSGLVLPIDHHVLSPSFFDFNDYKNLLQIVVEKISVLPDQHRETKNTIFGLIDKLKITSKQNIDKQKELLYYLNEIDRRRNLNWRKTFPWLEEHFKKCGIVE